MSGAARRRPRRPTARGRRRWRRSPCRSTSTRRAGRGARRAGPERRRQVDPAARASPGLSAAVRRARSGSAGVDARRRRDRDASSRPTHRPVGVVFQDYRLFPHLSVLDNVAFAPAVARAGPARRSRAAAGALARPARPGRPRRPPAGRAVRRPGPAGGARPGRWPATRRCCCSTSRWPRSTPAPGSTCRPSCARHLADFAGPVPARHPRPARGDGAGRPAAGARGRPGRPGGHARPRSPAARPPTTSPGWSASTSTPAPADGATVVLDGGGSFVVPDHARARRGARGAAPVGGRGQHRAAGRCRARATPGRRRSPG